MYLHTVPTEIGHWCPQNLSHVIPVVIQNTSENATAPYVRGTRCRQRLVVYFLVNQIQSKFYFEFDWQGSEKKRNTDTLGTTENVHQIPILKEHNVKHNCFLRQLHLYKVVFSRMAKPTCCRVDLGLLLNLQYSICIQFPQDQWPWNVPVSMITLLLKRKSNCDFFVFSPILPA